MRYKKVERIVTVEFVEIPGHPDYDIRITPEELVVRYGDTIVWDVQGLPQSRAEKIAFGSFELLVAYPRGHASARRASRPPSRRTSRRQTSR